MITFKDMFWSMPRQEQDAVLEEIGKATPYRGWDAFHCEQTHAPRWRPNALVAINNIVAIMEKATGVEFEEKT